MWFDRCRTVVSEGIAMSTVREQRRISIPDLRARKGGEPIVSLTAYTTPMARMVDPYADLTLVGDSLGMVLYGFESTLPVTLDMMIQHAAAVMRGAVRACVIVDMPFASYQESPEVAFRAAARVMAETGCSGVKLEGGIEMAATIAFLAQRNIPVLGHVGLMPQAVHRMGGYRAQGRDAESASRVVADAKAVAEAGAFAIVIENTVEPVAREATAAVAVPTIGIGASVACDGQVLVTEDLTGLSGQSTPRFVKRYAELGHALGAAVGQYAADVRARRFPGPEHCQSAPRLSDSPGADPKSRRLGGAS